jgi:endonuclease-3
MPRLQKNAQAYSRTELQARAEAVLERLAPIHREALPSLRFRSPFELLVATVLSAQCTDARVNTVTPALFAHFPDPRSLAAASRDEVKRAELESIIFSTGFYRAKARSLSLLALEIVEKHHGAVPGTMEALTALPGVGRKTAGVILSVCFGVPAIIVDTHFGRVARRLRLAESADPVKLEAEIAEYLPKEKWTECSRLLNLHGRKLCFSRAPDCGACVLSADCPSRSLK